jgi:hypothetical protein
MVAVAARMLSALPGAARQLIGVLHVVAAGGDGLFQLGQARQQRRQIEPWFWQHDRQRRRCERRFGLGQRRHAGLRAGRRGGRAPPGGAETGEQRQGRQTLGQRFAGQRQEHGGAAGGEQGE